MSSKLVEYKTAVERHFSPKGGNIDLLVETNISGSELQKARLLTMGTIQWAIGEQKIDIVTIETGKNPKNSYKLKTIRTGILL